MADINKFNTLNSIILDEINSVYVESLDYALLEDDIKNFAIAGKYGAGKSTIWNSYKKERLQNNKISGKIKSKLNNIITISLGKYVDTTEKSDNSNIILESRVERQIINQILAQIDDKSSNQCKYRFKVTRELSEIYKTIISLSIFVSVIYFFIIKEDIFLYLTTTAKLISYLICFICFLFGVVLLIYELLKNRNITFSSINFQGVEAKFDNNNLDETILERDIKEIVLLLYSSKVEVVVFEDLDRYDNLDLFTRLRELNYLLNSFIINNKEDRIVKFVYMIKDSLFISKNRTKFFDFIIPIVPIVDAKTSESHLFNLFKNIEDAPNKEFLFKISLYIDDMRLLKNIVNEYIIYSKIIPLSQLNLDKDILFSLMAIKNIFPKEFELLQEDKGYIVDVLTQLKSAKNLLIYKFNEKIDSLGKEIECLKKTIIKNEIDELSLLIPTHIAVISGSNKQSWAQFLTEWNKEPEKYYNINEYNSSIHNYNYKLFLERYIFSNAENTERLNKLPTNLDIKSQIQKSELQIQKTLKERERVYQYNIKKIIASLTPEEVETLFSEIKSDIKENYYFPLIRFLILNNYINESYYYYKGYYNVKNTGIISVNDIIYMKGLFEDKKIDVLFKIDNPREVIARLHEDDFKRGNFLNKYILEACLIDNKNKHIISMTASIDERDDYKMLIVALKNIKRNHVEKYINILIEKYDSWIIRILNACIECDSTILHIILVTILSKENIKKGLLNSFKTYIERYNELIFEIPKGYSEIVIINLQKANIKFNSLNEISHAKEIMIQLEKINAYQLSVTNVIELVKSLFGKSIEYGNLLNEVFTSIELVSTKKYIKDNFTNFIQQYILECPDGEQFINNENIVLEILNSDILEREKIFYISHNQITISNLANLKECLKNISILHSLLINNTIRFSTENLLILWNSMNRMRYDLITYINRNLNAENAEGILHNNIDICNQLINSSILDFELFKVVSKFVNNKIKKINRNLSVESLNLLIENSLIEITEHNIKSFVDRKYEDQIIKLLEIISKTYEINFISMLVDMDISDELAYRIINSNLSQESIKILIDFLGDRVLVKKIRVCSSDILKIIIDQGLSDENTKYIIDIFDQINLKREFIQYLVDSKKLDSYNDVISENIVIFLLKLEDIDVDIKVDLIINKILHRAPLDSIKEYILKVPEIAELATVWEQKYPLVDNEQKKLVANALANANMIKYRQWRNEKRIMCC